MPVSYFPFNYIDFTSEPKMSPVLVSDHDFVVDPHGRDQCDAKVQEGGRTETCCRPRAHHIRQLDQVDRDREAMRARVGTKLDAGKRRWDLLPWAELEDVVAVMEHGLAIGYPEGNWQKVEQPFRRYFSAAVRHLVARWSGEKLDPKSGRSHYAHAACCILFLMWHEKEREA